MRRGSFVVRRSLADHPAPTPQPTPCRLWQGYADRHGYGRRHDGERVHRWVWRLAHGAISPGVGVLHRCDNPPCYRLDHLFVGTHTDNMRDMAAKGRSGGTPPRPPQTKLTEDQVRYVRSSPLTRRELAAELGVSMSNIKMIRTGKTWRAVP